MTKTRIAAWATATLALATILTGCGGGTDEPKATVITVADPTPTKAPATPKVTSTRSATPTPEPEPETTDEDADFEEWVRSDEGQEFFLDLAWNNSIDDADRANICEGWKLGPEMQDMIVDIMIDSSDGALTNPQVAIDFYDEKCL